MNHKLILLMLLGPILAQKCPSWSLSQLVSISPLIVEASVLAHGQIDSASDRVQVTFKVKKSMKNVDKIKIKYIRMTFALSNHSNELCHPVTLAPGFLQDHQHRRRRKRRKFLIFAKNSRLFGFEPIVSPLRRSKRAKQALQRALCAYQSQYCHKSKSRNFYCENHQTSFIQQSTLQV